MLVAACRFGCEAGGSIQRLAIVLQQQNNNGRDGYGYLPDIQIEGLTNPVLQVFRQNTGELEYELRIKGQSIRPKVYKDSQYHLRIGEPDKNIWKVYDNLRPSEINNKRAERRSI